jgi:DNA-binding GntR family transcriptional regulator
MSATVYRRLSTAVMATNMAAMALCDLTGDTIGFVATLLGASFAGAARIYFREVESAMPGYREIAMRLRWELKEEHEWEPGLRLPSHTDLARRLGTTRTTVRRAIDLLAEEGLIEVLPGRGTFVAGEPPAGGHRSKAVEQHVRRNAQLGLHIQNADSLAVSFSVSPSTVRRVMARLVSEGVIRRAGRGGYEAP